ncbi:hypothetical protein WA026_014598 [Henosepilachna vigintioctopunctata]|uniref:Uncharacterized protein n=1 Tax=Henosepilachna vigintioctopunctata TaxID=420089 RepID=A0AAW1VCW2_9CUCU
MSHTSLVAKIKSYFHSSNRNENNVNKQGVDTNSQLSSNARFRHWYSIFQKKMENEEASDGVNSSISVAVVKLSLDNLVDNSDVQDICESNTRFISRSDFEVAEKCQFCQKESKLLELCCPIKELQVGVFKKAITNSLRRHSTQNFVGTKPYSDQFKENWISASEPELPRCKKNIVLDISKGRSTFLKLKKKLDNIRQFYPDLFYAKESIIDMWSRDDTLQLMTFEFLDYDENSNINDIFHIYYWI